LFRQASKTTTVSPAPVAFQNDHRESGSGRFQIIHDGLEGDRCVPHLPFGPAHVRAYRLQFGIPRQQKVVALKLHPMAREVDEGAIRSPCRFPKRIQLLIHFLAGSVLHDPHLKGRIHPAQG
jgi:hypothetical protein